MNTRISPPSYGFNSIIAAFLQGWLLHQIPYEGWYAIKKNEIKRNGCQKGEGDEENRVMYMCGC